MAKIQEKKVETIVPFEINGRWFGIPLPYVEGLSPVCPIVAIPGNASRVFVGISYILGQIMSVVDCGPLVNVGRTVKPSQVLIVRFGSAYYAFFANQIGQLIAHPHTQSYKKPLFNFARQYVDVQDKKISLLDVETIIPQYVCT